MLTLNKSALPVVSVHNADDIYDIECATADMRDGDSALRIEISGRIEITTAPCNTDAYASGCECPQCDSFGVVNCVYWMT